jgi:hypothetical protein
MICPMWSTDEHHNSRQSGSPEGAEVPAKAVGGAFVKLRLDRGMHTSPDWYSGGEGRAAVRRERQPTAATVTSVRTDGDEPAASQRLERGRESRAIHGKERGDCPHVRRLGPIERHEQRELAARQTHAAKGLVKAPCEDTGGALDVKAEARVSNEPPLMGTQACTC